MIDMNLMSCMILEVFEVSEGVGIERLMALVVLHCGSRLPLRICCRNVQNKADVV